MKVKDLRRHLSKLDDDSVVLVCIEEEQVDSRWAASKYLPVSGWIAQHVEKKVVGGMPIIEPTYAGYDSNAVVLHLKEVTL
jgi:hypothetical protein